MDGRFKELLGVRVAIAQQCNGGSRLVAAAAVAAARRRRTVQRQQAMDRARVRATVIDDA